MDASKTTVKTWEKTKLQNLVRHKSGKYYVRMYRNGKEIWKSLKTSHFSVAEARLAVKLKEHRERKGVELSSSHSKMTFGAAATLKLAQVNDDVTIKRSTRKYWEETITSLKKSWPELFSTEIRRVAPGACQEWAAKYAKAMSATRFNGAVTALRHIFDLAIEYGVIYANPAAKIERRSVKAKKLELPTTRQFESFVVKIRGAGCRQSQDCGDLVEGLAYTGCRIAEAGHIQWRDLDFTAGEITVKGDPDEATKNGEIRRVPMIPRALALFQKMRKSRPKEALSESVFRVRECQKAMTNAAKKVGMARITHHDLRHFFATVCIESGVDIPTVSRWLGHKDGGALAMRTYGHLRREHSVAQAQKVVFQSQ